MAYSPRLLLYCCCKSTAPVACTDVLVSIHYILHGCGWTIKRGSANLDLNILKPRRVSVVGSDQSNSLSFHRSSLSGRTILQKYLVNVLYTLYNYAPKNHFICVLSVGMKAVLVASTFLVTAVKQPKCVYSQDIQFPSQRNETWVVLKSFHPGSIVSALLRCS